MPSRRTLTERAQGDLVSIWLISFLLQSGNSFLSQNFCPPRAMIPTPNATTRAIKTCLFIPHLAFRLVQILLRIVPLRIMRVQKMTKSADELKQLVIRMLVAAEAR